MKRKLFVLIPAVLLLILVLSFNTYAAFDVGIAKVGGPGTTWETDAQGVSRVRCGNEYVKNGWFKWKSEWYLLNAEGYMLTGWQPCNGTWYYLTEVATAEHPFGSCYINCVTPDGHTVDGNGAITDGIPAAVGNPYGHSCVDVNITTQTVTVYVGTGTYFSTPCVTGKLTEDRMTKTGYFQIYAKQTDRILRGEKKADGTYEYESHVDYWMPFNGGQGLHDASWRSSFGGTIYKNSGSHGCVNLPLNAAAAIYDVAYIGMPVNVHE